MLELLLTKLRHAVVAGHAAPHLQIIAMTATMGRLDRMCAWLDAVRLGSFAGLNPGLTASSTGYAVALPCHALALAALSEPVHD